MNDQEKVRAGLPGDDNAFAAFYRRHWPAVLRMTRRYLSDPDLAEDAAHATFKVAWDRRRDFVGRSSVTTWLCGIAKRICLARLRKLRRSPPVESLVEEPACDAPWADDPAVQAERAEIAQLLELAEMFVSTRERDEVRMHVCDRMSCQEIGRLLGLKPKTVDSHIRRTLAKMRRVLVELLKLGCGKNAISDTNYMKGRIGRPRLHHQRR